VYLNNCRMSLCPDLSVAWVVFGKASFVKVERIFSSIDFWWIAIILN